MAKNGNNNRNVKICFPIFCLNNNKKKEGCIAVRVAAWINASTEDTEEVRPDLNEEPPLSLLLLLVH